MTAEAYQFDNSSQILTSLMTNALFGCKSLTIHIIQDEPRKGIRNFYKEAPKEYNYNLLFGVNVNNSLTKAERLLYGDTVMTHAMLFTGVSTDESDRPTKFRVENSWGDDKEEKGYIMMTADWFKENGFEVVVDKKYVPKEIVELEKLEPKVLPAWDPMGALAS